MTTFNTGNPVPSTDAKDLSDNAETLDKLINSTSDSTITRTGKSVATVDHLEKQYLFTAVNGGVWAAGQTFTAFNQYMVFSGTAYKPKNTTALPYVTGATPDAAFVEVVGNSSTAQIINDLSQSYTFDTVALFKDSLIEFPDGKTIHLNDRAADFTKITGVGTANTANIIASTLVNQSIDLIVKDEAKLKSFGGTGDGLTDEGTIVGLWLDYLIANNVSGYSGTESDVYLIDDISKAANAGIKITGDATFKATGVNRLNMFRLTAVKGLVDIAGVTFDGNGMVARPFEIRNTSSVFPLLGTVCLYNKFKVINAKNNTPDTFTVAGAYIVGGFHYVWWDGEVDNIDSTTTSGSVTIGLWTSWTNDTVDDWIRDVVIGSKSRVSNVTNSNITPADADGCQITAPTTVISNITVVTGAHFEDCLNRSIKTQVRSGTIDGAVIKRSTGIDGLTDIDSQYSGVDVINSKVNYDGARVDNVIGITQRLVPNVSHADVSGNTLTITGAPSSNTKNMVQVFGTDNTETITNQGVTIHHNKVIGTVDHLYTAYGTNVADVNVITEHNNYVETIGISWLNMQRVFANRAQLSVISRDSICRDGCTGSTIVSSGDLKVLLDYNNQGITALLPTPFTHEVIGGVLTMTGEKTTRVKGEGGIADDINTIVMTNYSPDEILTLYNNTASALTYKDGVGNLKLAGDAVLASINDTLRVRFNGTDVCEVSRSING